MNAKKILKQAFKSVPEEYVNDQARIFVQGTDNMGRCFNVIIAHPTLPHIKWTQANGWEQIITMGVDHNA